MASVDSDLRAAIAATALGGAAGFVTAVAMESDRPRRQAILLTGAGAVGGGLLVLAAMDRGRATIM